MQALTKRIIRLSYSTTQYISRYSFSETEAAAAPTNEATTKKSKTKAVATTPQIPKKIKKAAIVLSGCGVYDGSEITEAVSFFIALSSRKIEFKCFAPNKDQAQVINHLTGQPLTEKRNTLVESARITRGKVEEITNLTANEFDAVFFPGGFGAAKNLSNLAFEKDFYLDSEVDRVLKDFHANKKVIGLACIAPMLAVKALGNQENKLHVTLGSKGDKWPYSGNIELAESLGAIHKAKQVSQTCVDKKNLVFTAPAFMKETHDFSEVYNSINNLVQTVEDTLVDFKFQEGEKKDAKREKRAIKREKKAAKKAQQTTN